MYKAIFKEFLGGGMMKTFLLLLAFIFSINSPMACRYEFFTYLVDFGDYYAGGCVTTEPDKASAALIGMASNKGYEHSFTAALAGKEFYKKELSSQSDVDYFFVIFQMVDPTEPHFIIIENDRSFSRKQNIHRAWLQLVGYVNNQQEMDPEVAYYNSFVKWNPFSSMAKNYSKHFSNLPLCN